MTFLNKKSGKKRIDLPWAGILILAFIMGLCGTVVLDYAYAGWMAPGYTWPDSTIFAGSTRIRDNHFQDLRMQYNNLRNAITTSNPQAPTVLPAAPTWTAGLSLGNPIRDNHIIELRNAIDAIYAMTPARPLPFNGGNWTNPGNDLSGIPIRRVHLMELRQAIEDATWCGDGICDGPDEYGIPGDTNCLADCDPPCAPDPLCDDGCDCTDDDCGIGICYNVLNDANCPDDSDPCTINERCTCGGSADARGCEWDDRDCDDSDSGTNDWCDATANPNPTGCWNEIIANPMCDGRGVIRYPNPSTSTQFSLGTLGAPDYQSVTSGQTVNPAASIIDCEVLCVVCINNGDGTASWGTDTCATDSGSPCYTEAGCNVESDGSGDSMCTSPFFLASGESTGGPSLCSVGGTCDVSCSDGTLTFTNNCSGYTCQSAFPGEPFSHWQACPNALTNIPDNTYYDLVASCASPSPKCVYTCEGGYTPPPESLPPLNQHKDCVAVPGICDGGDGTDDSACGTIDCDGLDEYVNIGTVGPLTTDVERCHYYNYADLSSNRCEDDDDYSCKDANTIDDCGTPSDTVTETCGECQRMDPMGCFGSTPPEPNCLDYAPGTVCAFKKVCDDAGSCIDEPAASYSCSTPWPGSPNVTMCVGDDAVTENTTTTLKASCTAGDKCEVTCNASWEINAAGDDCESKCFIAGTKILMADGTLKPIEEIEKGDIVQGSDQANEVKGAIILEHNGWLYSLNGGDYFVTGAHPFMTQGGVWKAFNPEAAVKENPNLVIEELKEGDVLVTRAGTVDLTKVDRIMKEEKVYNIVVNNSHDYYADGYLVHNKTYCEDDTDCLSTEVCDIPSSACVAASNCSLDGVNVDHRSSRAFFSRESTACGSLCTTYDQVRNCYDGTLDGNSAYQYATCSVQSCDCPATTIDYCSLGAEAPGVATGVCGGGATGGCMYICNGPDWDTTPFMGMKCTPPLPPASKCPAQGDVWYDATRFSVATAYDVGQYTINHADIGFSCVALCAVCGDDGDGTASWDPWTCTTELSSPCYVPPVLCSGTFNECGPMGQKLDCSVYADDMGECFSTGCSWLPPCGGTTPMPCEAFTGSSNPTMCLHGGCTWTNSSGDCHDYDGTSEAICESKSGCTWQG